QHMAAGFGKGLIRWFSEVTPLSIIMAEEGMVARPGHVYMPPDEYDLTVDEEGLLHTPKNTGGHTPTGNKLLSSVASAYGTRAMGIVMTGMGDDGAQGLLDVKKSGGLTFAQDEFTSVVFGMPQAAHACGATSELIPLESIAPLIMDVCAG